MNNKLNELSELIKNSKNIIEIDYTFLPVAIEDELISFENKFNVKIPSDYRWFLLNISNGIKSKNDWEFDIINKVDFVNFWYKEEEYNPSIPFKLDKKILSSDPEDLLEDLNGYPYEYNACYDYEEYIYLLKEATNGIITLFSYGCGTTGFLVVNGNEYGNIWIDDDSSNATVYPEYDIENNKKRLNFIDHMLWCINGVIKDYYEDIEFENKAQEKENLELTINNKTEENKDFFEASNKHNNKKNFIFFCFIIYC